MTPIQKAKELFDTIEDLRNSRSELQIKHANEIGGIDSQLNMLYAKLGGTLDAAANLSS